jgi:ABC-type uncharacterized transport system involved in gliding motility auxiliary subunit
LNFAALTHHPDITLDIPRKPLAMPIEMPLMAAATSTLVATPAILPIQTTETTETAFKPDYYNFNSILGNKYVG